MTDTNPQPDMIVQYRSMTPSEYQIRHRYEDAVRTISDHRPKGKTCLCGAELPDGWAAHLAALLYPMTRPSMQEA